ncbi:hypothetical protein [Paraclostridium bifermentans]|uniref:hypothetical protein n=1 Tax=Paraclostridium bifermentans TaxID=1490 RepID=UPI00189FA65E|nr:hypothetical protein [Paraclostridium bifermentans]
MIMTDRDKKVCKFIEDYGAITTTQAKWIFFNGLQTSTMRRLNQLEKYSVLTSYHRGKRKVYNYADGKKLKEHDLGAIDFYAWIYKQGGKVLDFVQTPEYFNGKIKPDALVKFKFPYEGKMATIYAFLEYDLNHYTEVDKIRVWYEKLYEDKIMSEYCGSAEFPFLIIARPTTGIRYNSKNFNILYCDLNFTDLEQMLVH